MLQEFGWQDFQSRRRDLRLALLYKVVICNKCNDEVIVLAVCSGGVLQEV